MSSSPEGSDELPAAAIWCDNIRAVNQTKCQCASTCLDACSVSPPTLPAPLPVSPGHTQGFSSVTEKVAAGSTVWGAAPLPQNRELMMVSSGDGSLHLYKYHYPDQRKIKVRWRARVV